MMFLLFLTILILSFAAPKSRWVSLLALGLIFVMYSFAYYDGDLQTYRWIYEEYGVSLASTTFEPGFTLLIILCKKAGLSFSCFRMLLAAIYVVLLYKGVSTLTKYRALTISLSIIFPFFIFASVMRSGIACVILLNAYRFLFDRKYGRSGIIKYLICLMIAVLFHYSAIMMLALVFAKRRINAQRVLLYAACMAAIALLLLRTGLLLSILSRVTSREKTLQWLQKGEGTANAVGTLAILLVLFVNVFMNQRSLALLGARRSVAEENTYGIGQELAVSSFSYHASVIVFFLLPLMLLASPFLRILYMLIPVIIANCVNAAFRVTWPQKEENTQITAHGILTVLSLILWKLHYDWPYLHSGYIPLQELLSTKFVFY